MLLQVATDTVFEQDERLDQDFSLGRIDRIEHRWKICVAVFEQVDAVAADPFDSRASQLHLAHQRRVVRQRRPRTPRQLQWPVPQIADVDPIEPQQRPARGKRAGRASIALGMNLFERKITHQLADARARASR